MMKKQSGFEKTSYFSKEKFYFSDGRWEVRAVPVLEFLNIDGLVEKYKTNYGVQDSFQRLEESSTFWNEDIMSHWLNSLIWYLSVAKWNEAFENTQGKERDKFNAADKAKKVFEDVYK